MRLLRSLSLLLLLASPAGATVGCGDADAREEVAAPTAGARTVTPATPERAATTESDPTEATHSAPEREPASNTAERPRFDPPLAGERVSVPAGTLLVGSRPGLQHRSPLREADLVPVEIPAFTIDRLPYPNDPAQPARTQVSRPQAEALCQERGLRLCDELEWERACKGDSADDFVTGATFQPNTCGDAYVGCTSSVGVSALGVGVSEWTATTAPRALRADAATWMVRGASSEADDAQHRCGARHVVDPSAPSLRIGFRCCGGEAPGLSYPSHEPHPLHELVEADSETLAGYLRQMPEVARFAEGFVGTGASAAGEVLERGHKTEEDLAGWRPITGLLRWSPTEGEHVWVFSGAGAGASLIVVAHPMPDGTLVHGASFVFEGETPPVIVAYSPGTPNALKWSTCWDCAGEGGVIMMRDGRVTIAQR
ncbi:MAG: hypothetical protein R3B40_12430 [Polyangiales bacterium]|nr:hypothetical protein [Myxococcales bacterium]